MTGAEPGPHGILLHLSGPLQAWGERSRFTHQRDTAATPTRSGLIGLICAAQGRGRHKPVDDLAPLRFTVRSDRPGTLMRDLHTVGGGMPRELTVATAEGKRRPGATGTLLSHRYYLQDAAFTVAITTEDHALLHDCAAALRRPEWPPYLGRRSCPPSGPMMLAGPLPGALAHLLRIPLARPAPGSGGTVVVDFTSDQPLDRLPVEAGTPSQGPTSEAEDDPVSFAPLDRRYRARPVYRSSVRLPASLCAGYGADYLTALHTYLQPESTTEAS